MAAKLLILINRFVIGGQTLDTIPLAYYFKKEFDVLVLYGEKENDEEEALFLLDKYPGITAKKIAGLKRAINPWNDIMALFKIHKEIKKFNCSIIHTHGFKPGLIGRLAAWISRVPCIVHTYHGNHFHSYYNHFVSACLIKFERLLCRINTIVIAISHEQKNELVHRYKIVPENKVAVVHLGIDETFFFENAAEKRKNFRSGYALMDDEVAVGIVGRIVPIKNHLLFVNVAAELLLSSKIMLRFFVIGDGKQKFTMQQQFDRLGVLWCDAKNFTKNAQVIFTSWVEDISATMHGLDIVVLTSHNEGTPMSLIEAQFCGKPVVATDVGGVRDTFFDTETGFLVPGGDEKSFAQKLGLLISEPSLRDCMGKKAVAFATAKFSKAEEIKKLRELYKSCPQKK